MAAAFAAGLFCIGIGTGIAFAEYSSFSYGGRKRLGNAEMITERFEEERTEGIPFLLRTYREIEIIVDENLPDNKLVFEFEYAPEYMKTEIYRDIEEIQKEEWISRFGDIESMAGTETEEGSGKAEDETEVLEQEESANLAEGEGPLELEVFYIESQTNEMELMWRAKDEVLQAIKERKVYDFDTQYWGKTVVYMSPEARKEMIWD